MNWGFLLGLIGMGFIGWGIGELVMHKCTKVVISKEDFGAYITTTERAYMTPKMEHMVARIRDPKLHDILRAGGIYGNALRDLYTEAALEALAERIIDLETQCAEAGTYVKENPE